MVSRLNFALDVATMFLTGYGTGLFILNNVADAIYLTVVAVLINTRRMRK